MAEIATGQPRVGAGCPFPLASYLIDPMPSPHRGTLALFIAGLASWSACAPATQVDREHLAPPSRATISARLEPTSDGHGRRIVVYNRSSADIRVTSVHLHECENIRNRCELVRFDVLVPSGQSRHVTTVDKRDTRRSHRFRYSWDWEIVRDVAGT